MNLENILKRGNLLLNSPFMVDKDTGEIHEFGTAYPIEKYLQDYEEKKNNLSQTNPDLIVGILHYKSVSYPLLAGLIIS